MTALAACNTRLLTQKNVAFSLCLLQFLGGMYYVCSLLQPQLCHISHRELCIGESGQVNATALELAAKRCNITSPHDIDSFSENTESLCDQTTTLIQLFLFFLWIVTTASCFTYSTYLIPHDPLCSNDMSTCKTALFNRSHSPTPHNTTEAQQEEDTHYVELTSA